MNGEVKMLFGVNDLESARQALATVGALVKEREDFTITLFHGAPDPALSPLAKLLRLTPEAVEEYRKICSLEEAKVLEQARESLLETGFGRDRIALRCEGKCHDPAAAMLQLASTEGLGPIVLTRRRRPLLERMFMGAVTYRVVQMAEWRSLWLVDPPVASHDVLVPLVGAPVSRRVMDHVIRHFAHLRESRFTLFHVIPPIPPIYWDNTNILNDLEREEREQQIAQWTQDYSGRVEEIAQEGSRRLCEAGVPEANVRFKVKPATRGMAGDILAELGEGNHGILVIGRKGSKEISPFRLGSIASKLLDHAQRCLICLVN